ncbi:hypothetical protein Vafri_697 [Volvox africanus]|nr:hypothetical protein Vafri_697 [Volvox africanus]
MVLGGFVPRTCCTPLPSYYFETIFPRIPKPVQDAINEELKSRNLPTTAKGNGGAGGADRRGVDDTGNRRPASVKASLSVAFGQRAPNRSGAREEGRGRDPSATMRESTVGSGKVRSSASPDPPRDRDRREPPPARRDYDRDRDGRGGGASSDRRDRGYDRDRRDAREKARVRDERDYGREHDRDRARRSHDDRTESRHRSRSRSNDRRDGGRDARDVFREGAARERRGNEDDVRARYGSGSSRR